MSSLLKIHYRAARIHQTSLAWILGCLIQWDFQGSLLFKMSNATENNLQEYICSYKYMCTLYTHIYMITYAANIKLSLSPIEMSAHVPSKALSKTFGLNYT